MTSKPNRDPFQYFTERARRASIPKALDILKRAGVGNPPMKGDELRPRRKRTRTRTT